MGTAPGGLGFSHAVTVAAPQEGVLNGKRDLLGSQAYCGHAPGTLGSHQRQETLRSPGWPLLLLVYQRHSQDTAMKGGERRLKAKADRETKYVVTH